MKTLCQLLFCTLFLALSQFAIAGEQSTDDWLLQYAGKSTNTLRWDKRIEQVIKKTIPKKNHKDLLDALSGPPDPVYVVKDRFVSMSACVAHACPMKGFFWLDIEQKIGLGAIWGDDYEDPDRLIITSNSAILQQFPAEAKLALINWISENNLHPKKVKLIDGKGKEVALDAASFQAQIKFSPPEAGPSFDCLKASSAIEKSICATEALAKADLSVSTIFSQIKLGHAELAARKELLDFQRAWIKERNAKCASDKNLVPCLEKSYQEQHDKLMHWKPRG